MPEKRPRRYYPDTVIWIAKEPQIKKLVRELVSMGFLNADAPLDDQTKFNGKDAWYYDSCDNNVTIYQAKKKNEFVLNCSRGCLPIVADLFGGLDKFRNPLSGDFNK